MKVNFIEAVRIARNNEGKFVAITKDNDDAIIRLLCCKDTGAIQTVYVDSINDINLESPAFFKILPKEVVDYQWEILPEFQ